MEYFATANGITVHLLDTEKGNSTEKEKKTIVLLHGYMETMNIWNEFIDRLKGEFRVITMDMPGHGLSDSAPAGVDGQSVNTMDFCADVVKSVLDICNVQKAVIGGHSMGGYVAETFCVKYPGSIEKLILFNSNPYADSPEKSEDRKRETDIIRSGKLEYDELEPSGRTWCLVGHFQLPPLGFSIMLVHTEKVSGKYGSLVTAGTATDFDGGVTEIPRVFRNHENLQFVGKAGKGLFDGGKFGLCHSHHFRVGITQSHLPFFLVVQHLQVFLGLDYGLFNTLVLLVNLVITSLVAQNIGIAQFGFQFFVLFNEFTCFIFHRG